MLVLCISYAISDQFPQGYKGRWPEQGLDSAKPPSYHNGHLIILLQLYGTSRLAWHRRTLACSLSDSFARMVEVRIERASSASKQSREGRLSSSLQGTALSRKLVRLRT